MRSEEYFVEALKNLNTRDEICVLQRRISLLLGPFMPTASRDAWRETHCVSTKHIAAGRVGECVARGFGL
jgi:hypothetical protein